MANDLRLYRAMPNLDADWQILVVAHSLREAKRLGWPEIRWLDTDLAYIDARYQRVRQVAVPPEITEAMVIDHCDDYDWTCAAWGHKWCPITCPQWKEGDSGE